MTSWDFGQGIKTIYKKVPAYGEDLGNRHDEICCSDYMNRLHKKCLDRTNYWLLEPW